MTLTSDWFSSLRFWTELAKGDTIHPCLFYGGDVESEEGDIRVIPWHGLHHPETLPPPLR